MNKPTDVEILLISSDKKYYKTDERRIGFQIGAKWMRSEAEQQNYELKSINAGLVNQLLIASQRIKELENKLEFTSYKHKH